MGLLLKVLEIDNNTNNCGLYPNGTQRKIKKFNIFKWKWIYHTQTSKIKSFTDGDGVIYDNVWTNVEK